MAVAAKVEFTVHDRGAIICGTAENRASMGKLKENKFRRSNKTVGVDTKCTVCIVHHRTNKKCSNY
jgi:hypothetical protein